MAKVHKARKSTAKYSFQKKKISPKVLLIILAVIVIAAIGLKVAYDKHLSGEFEVAAPTAEQMANIADNWEILNTHTDKIANYYTMMGLSADGTDGNGNVLLLYTGHEDIEEISIQILGAQEVTDVNATGAFARTSLADFINGVAPWNQATKQIVAENGKCAVVIYDEATEALDGAILADVIAELEAIIAEGPVVTEEAPVEEVPVEEAPAETTEEVPAE